MKCWRCGELKIGYGVICEDCQREMVKVKNSITSEELSQQFLSKELVLRKIDEEIANTHHFDEKKFDKSNIQIHEMMLRSRLKAIKDDILNECSAKENSLLKKLEAFSSTEKDRCNLNSKEHGSDALSNSPMATVKERENRSEIEEKSSLGTEKDKSVVKSEIKEDNDNQRGGVASSNFGDGVPSSYRKCPSEMSKGKSSLNACSLERENARDKI